MVDLNTVFGDEHSWGELRGILTKHLRKKFPGATAEDIEDAAGDGILDLCDYWAGLSSSMTADTARNWSYALWRATKRASSALYRDLERLRPEVSMETPVHDAGTGQVVTLGDLLAAKPAQDADMTDDEYQAKVQEFIDSIPPEDLETWLNPMVRGESVRAEARRTGAHYRTVHRNRQRGKARLSVVAQQFGLRVA
jgi:DNA-directed RNA polymerase specialized sigma24 family protein